MLIAENSQEKCVVNYFSGFEQLQEGQKQCQ